MKIGFIGMGNMAFAIVKGILESGYIEAKDIYAYDVDQEKLRSIHEQYHIRLASSTVDVVNKVDIVILAVKPNIADGVVLEIKQAVSNKAVVSIVAGYGFETFNTLFLSGTRHLSVMPNTPAMVQQGVTLFEKQHSLTDPEFLFVKGLFESIGTVEILPSYMMSAACAISGCGPAFMYIILEALADGGVMEGLPRDMAYRLASQTMIGAGMMQLQTKEHPGVLKDSVCSPGGITIRGVEALEDANVRSAFIKAINKAK